MGEEQVNGRGVGFGGSEGEGAERIYERGSEEQVNRRTGGFKGGGVERLNREASGFRKGGKTGE